MEGSIAQSYLSDILHAVSQALLAPDIILLLLFMGYAVFCIGSVVAEYFTERRHFKVVMPKFLAALMSAREDEIPEAIEKSGLLKRQKVALLTVYDYRTLPGDALVALIRRLVSEEESRYDRISGRNNMAARVSPMLGLMGTLIPLGPGIQALGKADTAQLSSSLLVAFDTTVAGLVVAAVCLVIGKIRTNWYGNYMSALDSGMATMLQKIEDMRAEGKITVEEPSNYAFLFEQAAGKKSNGKGKAAKETKPAKGGDGQDPTDPPRTDFSPTPASQPLSQMTAPGLDVAPVAGMGAMAPSQPPVGASAQFDSMLPIAGEPAMQGGIPNSFGAPLGVEPPSPAGIEASPVPESGFGAMDVHAAPIQPLLPQQPESGDSRPMNSWYQPQTGQSSAPSMTYTPSSPWGVQHHGPTTGSNGTVVR